MRREPNLRSCHHRPLLVWTTGAIVQPFKIQNRLGLGFNDRKYKGILSSQLQFIWISFTFKSHSYFMGAIFFFQFCLYNTRTNLANVSIYYLNCMNWLQVVNNTQANYVFLKISIYDSWKILMPVSWLKNIFLSPPLSRHAGLPLLAITTYWVILSTFCCSETKAPLSLDWLSH